MPQQQSNAQFRPPRNTPKKGRSRRDSTLTPRNSKSVAKNYASENDVPQDNSRVRTPGQAYTGRVNFPASGFKGKPVASSERTRNNRPRPSNIATTGSPVTTRTDRPSPPLTAGKASAFAGGTYHASPAPSAIPIPSFLRKGPESPSFHKLISVSQEPSPPASDSETPPPSEPSSLQKEEHDRVQESPLEFFFKRDREEKERTRRVQSAQGLVGTVTPFNLPDQSPLRSHYKTGSLPRSGAPATGYRTFSHGSMPGISPEELNGSPSRPLGPAFSTPFNDRIRAARTGEMPNHSSPVATEQSTAERTQALKSLLSIGGHEATAGRPGLFPSSLAAGPGLHSNSAPSERSHMQGLSQPRVGAPADSVTMTNNLKNLLRIQ